MSSNEKIGIRWQSIALPAEHGGWGLTLEPIALGLLVAPSLSGFFLALASFAGFLAYQPFRIFWKEQNKGRRSSRRVFAQRFLLVFSGISIFSLLIVILTDGWLPLLPLAAATPLLIIFLSYDLSGPKRSWQAEISASVLFSSVSAGIAIASGWSLLDSLALWAVIIARAVPSILYIRARIKLEKGKPIKRSLPITAHLLSFAFVFSIVWLGYLPWLTLLPFAILILRAVIGLSAFRRPLKIKTIGFIEIGLGVFTVISIYLGFLFGL